MAENETTTRRTASDIVPDRATIRREVRLPWRKIFEFAWRGIRVRFGRSMLVTSGIFLAVAFLSYILFSDSLARSMAKDGPAKVVQELRRDGKLAEADDANARTQMWWMVGLALLVCFVGVLNAIMLAVAERFAEIGTMKCLGALDSLVLKMFLLESLFHGLMGTGGGLLIGVILSLLESWSTFGGVIWSLVDVVELLKLAGICLVTGILLTVAGALYPAWQASRMKPVEAMRLDI